ncbi:MAG: Hsp70 family protein [Deltaproteobacteria bacterium]|nr:MAG: Hsp70 family protein [Deltaproteobacteria bacterium]
MSRRPPRFLIGIDLGTTNCVLACADTAAPDAPLEVVPVPQVVAPKQVDAREALPSFLYLASPEEQGALDLPWERGRDFAVGAYARDRGAEVPARLVASAKSWLCHAGVDRTAAILPWGADADARCISPLDASATYLRHLRDGWDATRAHGDPSARLAAQEIYLTVPASFDASARELTVRAAGEAGLEHVVLLEEPQAACYAWIAGTGEAWRRQVRVGDVILVCDVGGGTTDLSLIAVTEEDGALALRRVAVGDHILLGGDNMDLALAYVLRERLAARGTALDDWQLRGLVHACRGAKERLLGDAPPERVPLAVLGRSRRVVGGALKVELTRADAEEILVDGFLPRADADARPQRTRRVGLQEMGLPYAADARLTAHLAEFLGRHADARPTAMLFNGGVFNAAAMRTRVLEVVRQWLGADVRELTGAHLEQAVARGAAYHGLARRGRGLRIRGGTARAYYIGVEVAMPAVPGVPPPMKAVCVVPRGMEEGTEADLPRQEFGLCVGEPAEFRMFGSSTREGDALGAELERANGELEELAPLVTTLPWPAHEGTVVPVRLHVHLTEIGTLELWCVARDGARRWKLEFGVRAPDPI